MSAATVPNNDAPPCDFVGRVITPGCTVVYPTRKGAEMWLSRGTVEAVNDLWTNPRLRVVTRTHRGDRRIVYIAPGRAVVVS